MNAVYEYLFMGLMLIVIFGASVTMVEIMSVPMQGVSERQELQVTGEKILSQMLSSYGSPANWGSSPTNTNPTYFGLAQQMETTRQTYVLDINKVQRLNPNDPYRLDPNAVQKALNLEKTFGFALQVMPIFNVNVMRQGVADSFTVNVSWQEDGLPVSNAKVTACMFLASVSNGSTTYYQTLQRTSTTGIDGETLQPLDFTPYGLAENRLKVLVVVVDYLGLKSSHTFSADDWQTVPAYRVGEYLLINNVYQTLSSNPTLYEILAIKDFPADPPQYDYKIISVSTTLTDTGTVMGDFRLYAITNPEPTAMGLVVVQKDGVYYLAFDSKEVNFNFSTTPDLSIFPPGVRLQRLVTIEDSPYYAQLYLWRLSY